MVLVLSACSPESGESPGSEVRIGTDTWFEEVAAQSGLDFQYRTGHSGRYLMPEIKGGGVGLLDYDADGLLDVFCVQAGVLDPTNNQRPTHRLFRNLGNWQFQDVTATAGVGGDGRYGMGCACADYDGDGHVDIHLTHVQGSLLYRNNGDGTFSDVTAQAGLTNVTWGVGSTFFDLDGDSQLDLFIANYLRWNLEAEVECFSRGGMPDYCSPLSYAAPAMDTLYRNRGDGTFEDITLRAGLDKAYGNGLGVATADFDRDGRFDLFVANDAAPNQLWMNQGTLPLVDQALIRGCAVNALGMSEAGMGISSVDLDNNGWRDLFVTHLVGEANRLFMNTNGQFLDVVDPAGPGITSWPYTSFGLGFFDFDHDGILDLYVANGRVKRADRDLDPNNPYAEPNQLLRGIGNTRFEEIPNAGGNRPLIESSRGAAFGDLDNDGDIDVVVVNRDGPTHLLRNVAPKQGHWITLRILEDNGSDAIGAEVMIQAGDQKLWRSVSPHESYASSNDPRVHCGLGPIAEVRQIQITWPDGQVRVFENLSADQFYKVRREAIVPRRHPNR
jgi:hypothetical protein